MRLEFVEGASKKFWEARLQGRELIVRWGRIGSSGQTTTHSFGDETAARAERDKLVREKTRKGYAVVEHDVDPLAPAASTEAKQPSPIEDVAALDATEVASPATHEKPTATATRITAAQARERAATVEPTKRNAEGVVTWTLFRGDGAAREFFEVSAAGREIEVARGKIGRAGRVREIAIEPGENVELRVQREIAKALVDGFEAGADEVPTPDVPDEEAPVRRRAEALFTRHRRTGYLPTVEDGEGALLDSRFGGRPALADDEAAPCCGRCAKPFTLIAQLRHDTLPAAAQRALSPALIQLFWCDTICQSEDGWEGFSAAHLARAVAMPHAPRLPRDEEMPERVYGPKRITAWTAVETYPNPEELRTLAPSDDETYDYATELREEDGSPFGSRPGERLLGWPAWIQGVENIQCRTCRVRMETALQVDTGTTLREIGFGDTGIAWMVVCPRCRAMTFTWQSC